MNYFSRVRQIYLKHVRDKDKEGFFLVLVFFTLTFVIARLTVYAIKYHWFSHQIVGNIFFKDIHIHHLVFGIMLLLIAGIIRIPRWDDNLVRFSSILYGIGAALTLDEFALWLRLNPDAYWGPEGRISIDAVVVFTLLLFLLIGYGNFLRKVLDHTIFYFFIRNRHGHRFFKKLFMRKKKISIVTSVFITVLLIVLIFSVVYFSSLFHHEAYKKQNLKTPISKLKTQLPIAVCSPKNPYPHISLPVSSPPIPTVAAKISDFCLNVPVFYMHHVQPWAQAVARGQTSLTVDNVIFAQQMAYLAANGYHTIPADQLIAALRNHTTLPPKTVVLTFDDGYQDIYDYVFPLMKKYNFIASLAIPTGLLGVHAATNYYLSWQELKEMVDSGHVVADDHTYSHADIADSPIDKAQFEILTAKQQLQQYLGSSQTTFFYPYGTVKPFDVSLLVKDGFYGAFTTNPGTLECASQIYELPRTRIANRLLNSYGL